MTKSAHTIFLIASFLALSVNGFSAAEKSWYPELALEAGELVHKTPGIRPSHRMEKVTWLPLLSLSDYRVSRLESELKPDSQPLRLPVFRLPAEGEGEGGVHIRSLGVDGRLIGEISALPEVRKRWILLWGDAGGSSVAEGALSAGVIARLQALFAPRTDLVLLRAEAGGRVEFLNAAGVSLTGSTPVNVLGIELAIQDTPSVDGACDEDDLVIAEPEEGDGELRTRTRNGSSAAANRLGRSGLPRKIRNGTPLSLTVLGKVGLFLEGSLSVSDERVSGLSSAQFTPLPESVRLLSGKTSSYLLTGRIASAGVAAESVILCTPEWRKIPLAAEDFTVVSATLTFSSGGTLSAENPLRFTSFQKTPEPSLGLEVVSAKDGGHHLYGKIEIQVSVLPLGIPDGCLQWDIKREREVKEWGSGNRLLRSVPFSATSLRADDDRHDDDESLIFFRPKQNLYAVDAVSCLLLPGEEEHTRLMNAREWVEVALRPGGPRGSLPRWQLATPMVYWSSVLRLERRSGEVIVREAVELEGEDGSLPVGLRLGRLPFALDAVNLSPVEGGAKEKSASSVKARVSLPDIAEEEKQLQNYYNQEG